MQVPTSFIYEEGNATSYVHLTFYSDINSVVDAYHYLVPAAWATEPSSIRTLTLSLVKPSLLSIKGDVLPPTKESFF